MTRTMHTCDDCGLTSTSAYEIATCCSPLNDPDDLNH